MTGYQSKKAAAQDKLAQPSQEPVAYDKTEMNGFVQDLYDKKMQESKHGHYETMFHVVHQAIKRATPLQPAQEPWPEEPFGHMAGGVQPPQRPWAGLTDDELANLSASGLSLWQLWRAIEAALKEKNNAA